MKKKFLSAVLCVILAFAMIFSVSAEPISTLIDNDEDTVVSEVITDEESTESAETTETEDAIAEEETVEEPLTTDDGNVIVPLYPDYDIGYGLYGGYDGQDSMDDPDMAGACVGWDPVNLSITSSDGLWWIDDYYVGAEGLYHTEKTDNFSLKYQIEFHASEDIAAEEIQIVIDASLGTYRNGNNILPDDAGIPYGTPDSYTTTSASPFNYYYYGIASNETEARILTASEAKTASDVQIVIWNYRDIVSGSNAMVQFLYSNLDSMQIPDMTEWNLTVEATVTNSETGGVATATGNTLTGVLDTSVKLNTVTKHAYTSSSVSYTPELYTQSQVNSYINGTVPEPYASNFSDYVYIVWDITISGSANQAYWLEAIDTTSANNGTVSGSIVGWSVKSSTGVSWSINTNANGDLEFTTSTSTNRSYSSTIYVVTAYPADEIVSDVTEIDNAIEVIAHPADGIDADIKKEASAMTTWGEYVWHYSGDIIGISKSYSETYRAYWELYQINKRNNIDTELNGTNNHSYAFTTKSTDRVYSLTHQDVKQTEGSDGTMGANTGEWIEGSYAKTTTVDDVLYVYAGSDVRQLDYDDYYYHKVNIVVDDNGYDIWEDKAGQVEMPEGIDQDVYISAMFADNPGVWEDVTVIPFNSSGTMSYTFSDDDIARQPYRIKVEHNSVNYVTYCTINLNVTLRATSPMITWCMEKYGDDLSNIEIENLSGVAGQIYGNSSYADGTYYQDQSYVGDGSGTTNYSEYDTQTNVTLKEWTQEMYGTILMRDNATKNLTDLEETASAYKTVTTENDSANARVLTNYYITAYEGYYVQDQSAVNTFKEEGITLPERTDVEFYDLLPYGMKYNGAVQPVAGRITSMNSTGTWRTNTGAWTKDVTVTVDEDDVIDNWNGTGRTMVVFHLHYNGSADDDISAYYSTNELWYQGYGIYFQAYYDWADMDVVDAEYNLAVYIAEMNDDKTNELLGNQDQNIWKDDGEANVSSQYSPVLVEDLNKDGVTDKYTNMYASTSTSTNVATASSDNIEKAVRADSDVMAEYGTTAVVGNGEGYTYEITVKNSTGATLSDIVVFDNLENATKDRTEVESQRNKNNVFDGLTDDEIFNDWYGTFNGLTLTAMEDAGIETVVWYNTNRDAKISSEDENPSGVLTTDNGWVKATEYTGDLADVMAIAVDITYKTNGEKFVLDVGEAISFQIHMIAPEDSEYKYAFNNPAYFSVSTDFYGSSTQSTDIGDTVRVEIGDVGTLSVEKEYSASNNMPDSMSNQKFTFELSRAYTYTDDSGEESIKYQILANQEYTLYEWNDEEWVSTGVVQSTDFNGQFTLKSGQKAVFSNLADWENVVATEIESVFWDSEIVENEDGTDGPYVDTDNKTIDYVFNNTYRSPVYLYKTTETTDLASDDELANAQFTFYIEVDSTGNGDYTKYVGEYIYVEDTATNGASPTVDTSKGEGGYGYISDGYVTIGIDDIIAFFPKDGDGNFINTSFRVTEVEPTEWDADGNVTNGTPLTENDYWVCFDNEVSGTTNDYGVVVSITNYYKYRAIILTKDLSDYDHDIDECTYEWTFKLTDSEGEPVEGANLYITDADSDSGYTSIGQTDSNGEFTVTGAGSNSRVVITGLVEGETYTITETNYDTDLFIPVQDNVTVTMPVYSITKNATITNRYLLRDLTVQKIALTKDTNADLSEYKFTFTLTKNGTAVAGAEYTIEGGDGTVYTTNENGQFTLHGGETAYFDDIGYEGDVYVVAETADEDFPQIYPTDNADGEATLDNNGGSIMFINGNFEDIASVSKTIVGMDDVGNAYVTEASKYGQTLDESDSDEWVDIDDGEDHTGEYFVNVTFGVYGSDNEPVTSATGALIDYTDSNSNYPYVYIYITSDGSITLKSYNGGEITQSLLLGDTIYIAEIGENYVKFDETQSEYGIIDGLYEVTAATEGVIGSDYIYVAPETASGTAYSNESVTLINDIWSGKQSSAIYKLMSSASENGSVPEGAELVFRVEQYDTTTSTWSPASGVRYITMDGYNGNRDNAGTSTTSGVLETGSDGKITLTMTDNGYPWIRFIDDIVYANVYDGTTLEDGQYRIVELLDESDTTWGRLVGYESEDWETTNGPALNVTPADTFVNGNDDSYTFEVEKMSSTNTAGDDDTFTFMLVQVTGVSQIPLTTVDDIVDQRAGNDIYYVIYDSETGERLEDGYTDANGLFTLKVGQYAEFYVPENTIWTVYENMGTGFSLIGVYANDNVDSGVLDETVGVLGTEIQGIPLGTIVLTVTDSDNNPLSNVMFELYDENGTTGRVFTSDDSGQIIANKLTDGTYYFVQVTTLGSGDVDLSHTYCIENMTWTEIIAQAKEDPTVFYGCLDNGCVKTVELTANNTLFNSTAVSNASAECGWSKDTVKYAVQIYGIYADNIETVTTDSVTINLSTETQYELSVQTVKPAALTFGAALGRDPTATENENFFSNYGVSTMYYLLNGTGASSYTYGANWNMSYTGYSTSDPPNVYSRSRIRTTLTGDQENIKEWYNDGERNNYYDKESDLSGLCDSSNCLFSCFPSELQEAIVPRYTTNGGAATSGSHRYDDIATYDVLWLPSLKEIGISRSYDDAGGTTYTTSDGKTALFSSDSARIAYEFGSITASSSSSLNWWSRSRNSNSSYSAYNISTSGSYSSTYVDCAIGLSPAFCIE